jgi:hypothetical protein
MAVFTAVVHSGAGFDEDVLHARERWDFGSGSGITAQLVRHDLARPFGTGGKHALEEAPGYHLVATLLQQNIEFGAVLIDCLPLLAAQGHEHFVEMPGRVRLATHGLNTMRETHTERFK